MYNTCVVGILEGERKGNRVEEISETILSENFQKLMIVTKPHIQESHSTPSHINT